MTAALRDIDAPRIVVGGEMLLDEEIGDLESERPHHQHGCRDEADSP